MPVSPDVNTDARERDRPEASGAEGDEEVGLKWPPSISETARHELQEQFYAPEENHEAHPHQRIATPDVPSPAEMAEHLDNGHAQYRNWCPECVEAFGREWAHRANY